MDATPPPVTPVYAITEKVPSYLPLVLRNRASRVLLLSGAVTVGVMVLGTAVVYGVAHVVWAERPPSLAVILLCGLVPLVQVPIFLLLYTSGGPTLAAGPNGIWVRISSRPVRSMWLPWEAIERVRVRPRFLDRQVVIVKKGTTPSAGFGTGFLVSLWLAGRGAEEMLRELRRYSSGRCAVR
jgi:hypothetical protein